jgi:hypothetical protein
MSDRPPQEPTPMPSRLESEINEILARTNQPPSPVVKFKSRAQRERAAQLSRVKSEVSSVRLNGLNLIILAAVLALMGYVLSSLSPLLAHLAAYGSIAALIVLYWQAFRRQKSSSRIKRWRGRDIQI